MELSELPWSVDQLTWSFLDMTDAGGRLAIMWDRVMAAVPFGILPDPPEPEAAEPEAAEDAAESGTPPRPTPWTRALPRPRPAPPSGEPRLAASGQVRGRSAVRRA